MSPVALHRHPAEPQPAQRRLPNCLRNPWRLASLLCVCLASWTSAQADPRGLLETIHRHKVLASTIPENGDVNPYAVVVAQVSIGSIEKDDVLIDNFNNISNLQGTGTTIVKYRPGTKQMTQFAQVPQNLKECPGGVGLTTAMTMLSRGWIIVGSTPSTDGTTRTKGDGCLLVFDANGKHVATWVGPTINGPWGNMVSVEHGDEATLFISMAGFGVPAPDVLDPATHYPVTVHQATVLRLEITLPQGQPPVLKSQTVIGDGFSQRADLDNFMFGPTGLALGPDDTLYVTDGMDNVITAIEQASTRTTSAHTGKVVTQDGLLGWPLAMVMTSAGHLLVCNGKNGQVVEIDPATGKQIYAHWLDPNQAQSPPGNGDLFGLALTPDGKGIYYVEDDVNALVLGSP
jgi:DNA-binding beta-propeller fold protein YncE